MFQQAYLEAIDTDPFHQVSQALPSNHLPLSASITIYPTACYAQPPSITIYYLTICLTVS